MFCIDQALSSYSAAKNKFSTANQAEVTTYRAWMEDNVPVHPSELRFLGSDHEGDLICLSSSAPRPRNTATNDNTNNADVRQLVFLLCVTMILLWLVFSMLPGFPPKLLLLCIVVGCMGSIVWKDFLRQHGSIAGSKKDA